MSEQRDSHELEPEDLEVAPEEAQDVKGGAGTQGIVSPRDPASGLPTGKANFQDFHFTHKVDKASPNLG